MSAWQQLGIEPTNDIRAIKKAYAIRLKLTHPDDDAQAYQQLREAYDWAQDYAKFHLTYGGDGFHEVARPIEPPEMALVESAEPTQALVPSTAPEASAEHDAVPPAVTLASLLKECAGLWAGQSTAGMVQEWPRLQALLEDLPIAEHNQASRAFAQFVVEETDLPVEVLIALTRHFQWGLDFRADQFLGSHLSHALYQRLSAADVFAAFHPEKYTQHAWALALTKLWDNKRGLLARLLAACLDYPTRHRVLQARLGTLQTLGASRKSAKTIQNFVAMGGVLQGIFFALLVIGALAFLYDPGVSQKSFFDAVAPGVGAAIIFFALDKTSDGYPPLFRKVRSRLNLDWTPLIPVLMVMLVYLDQHYAWLAGYSNSSAFLYGLVFSYLGLWLLVPTHEHPWRKLLLPTYFLLLFGVQEFFSKLQTPLLISLAFAWTLGAHVALRRYPVRFEWVYFKLIKLGFLRSNPWLFLAIKFIAVAWALVAIIMLPALLFRMAANYRVLYAVTAICAGFFLSHVRSVDGQTHGLLAWVLAVVFGIQMLQAASQRLADYGLKKLHG
jgi:hypothetical protein